MTEGTRAHNWFLDGCRKPKYCQACGADFPSGKLCPGPEDADPLLRGVLGEVGRVVAKTAPDERYNGVAPMSPMQALEKLYEEMHMRADNEFIPPSDRAVYKWVRDDIWRHLKAAETWATEKGFRSDNRS